MKHNANPGMVMPQFRCVLAICCLLLAPSAALAQERPGEPAHGLLSEQLAASSIAGHLLPAAANGPRLTSELKEARPPAGQQPSRVEKRTRTRTIFGAIVGAAGGFFAGGYTGAWIEGDGCHCDDPGLKGALIGAPVGAVLGGVLGARYLF